MVVGQLTQDEKLLLVGNVKEKMESKDSADSLNKKLLLTSDETKATLKTCSVTLGIAKAIGNIK